MTRITLSLIASCGMALCAAAPPAFDVVSVKPNKSAEGKSSSNFSTGKDSAKITFTGVTLLRCIQNAYGVRAYQVDGPDWLKSESYDIVASTQSANSREQMLPMLQALLADRFQLKFHRETRILPVYELVVAKSGLKIEPVQSNGTKGTWEHVGELTAKNESMADFAAVLSRIMDRPVIDKTELGAAYDFIVEYTREDREVRETPSAPSIFTALQEKLGLKLEPRKGPVEILVIDHAERVPTEN